MYRLIRFLALPFFKLFYMPKIKGRKNLPKEGNYVIICNHYGKADAIVLVSLYKQKIYFMAKKEWFSGKFKAKLFSTLGAIPVDREKADFASVKRCLEVIKRGDILAIFPEGTRNKVNDELQEVKGGAAMIAFMAKATVVPVALKKKFKAFHRNELYIGKPFDYSEYYGQRLNSALDETLTEKMRANLQKTVDIAQGKLSEEK